jgi:hypothetical protein
MFCINPHLAAAMACQWLDKKGCKYTAEFPDVMPQTSSLIPPEQVRLPRLHIPNLAEWEQLKQTPLMQEWIEVGLCTQVDAPNLLGAEIYFMYPIRTALGKWVPWGKSIARVTKEAESRSHERRQAMYVALGGESERARAMRRFFRLIYWLIVPWTLITIPPETIPFYLAEMVWISMNLFASPSKPKTSEPVQFAFICSYWIWVLFMLAVSPLCLMPYYLLGIAAITIRLYALAGKSETPEQAELTEHAQQQEQLLDQIWTATMNIATGAATNTADALAIMGPRLC